MKRVDFKCAKAPANAKAFVNQRELFVRTLV